MNTIAAQKRDLSKKAKQLRRAGYIPCAIYGAPLTESCAVQIDQKTASQLHRTMHNGSKVNIQLEGVTYPTLIKNLQYDVLNDAVVDISFQVLDPKRRIHSVAEIVLLNKDKVPGIVEQMHTQIPHAALPEYLVDTVTLDLENMPIGTVLTVGDIPEFRSDHIELLIDASTVVLRLSAKKHVAAETAETAETADTATAEA